jgi:hypothetical protein
MILLPHMFPVFVTSGVWSREGERKRTEVKGKKQGRLNRTEEKA